MSAGGAVELYEFRFAASNVKTAKAQICVSASITGTNQNRCIWKSEVAQRQRKPFSPLFYEAMYLATTPELETTTLCVEVRGPDDDTLSAQWFPLRKYVSSCLSDPQGGHFGKKESGEAGITIFVDRVTKLPRDVYIDMSGQCLDNVDTFSLSDPFLVFFKRRGYGAYVHVHRTEYIDDNLNPVWQRFTTNTHALCKSSPDATIKIMCYDFDKGDKWTLIGLVETSFASLLADAEAGLVESLVLTHPDKTAKKGGDASSGRLTVVAMGVSQEPANITVTSIIVDRPTITLSEIFSDEYAPPSYAESTDDSIEAKKKEAEAMYHEKSSLSTYQVKNSEEGERPSLLSEIRSFDSRELRVTSPPPSPARSAERSPQKAAAVWHPPPPSEPVAMPPDTTGKRSNLLAEIGSFNKKNLNSPPTPLPQSSKSTSVADRSRPPPVLLAPPVEKVEPPPDVGGTRSNLLAEIGSFKKKNLASPELSRTGPSKSFALTPVTSKRPFEEATRNGGGQSGGLPTGPPSEVDGALRNSNPNRKLLVPTASLSDVSKGKAGRTEPSKEAAVRAATFGPGLISTPKAGGRQLGPTDDMPFTTSSTSTTTTAPVTIPSLRTEEDVLPPTYESVVADSGSPGTPPPALPPRPRSGTRTQYL